jgi:AbrB family looped-hinge helix DNA binding protein
MTTKGQVTIPKAVRQQLGLRQGMRVAFVLEGDHAVLRPAVPERALPKSGFGMVKVKGPALPADFDVATLLKPAESKVPKASVASGKSVKGEVERAVKRGVKSEAKRGVNL